MHRRSDRAEATGLGSVAVTGNNDGNITTNVMIGGYERLKQVILNPKELYATLDLEHFTGRSWLFEQIDHFIERESRGYIVLEAGAGLGKTAFAATLATKRCWPQHFTDLNKASRAAINNIGAQLIASWELAELAPHGILPSNSGQTIWLEEVLTKAAERRDIDNPTNPIVYVVDGLDQVNFRLGEMPLDLPVRLPRGVYAVVTCRPGTVLPLYGLPVERIRLNATDDDNTIDIREYLKIQAASPSVHSWRTEIGMSDDEFVDRLTSLSGGVWIYLRYVLDDLSRKTDSAKWSFEELPIGLAGYYSANVCRWQADEDRWDLLYLPLIATLAALFESITLDTLIKFTNVTNINAARRFLDGPAGGFLAVTTEEPREYRILHESFRDFVTSRFPDSNRTTLAEEMSEAVRSAHGRICDEILASWGGINQNFALLQTVRDLSNDYGRKYITAHLEIAGRADDLARLLIAEFNSSSTAPIEVENLWYYVCEMSHDFDGYLGDLARAQHLVAEKTDRYLEQGITAPTIGSEVRYALMSAAVKTRASYLEPEVLAAAVENNIWPVEHAITHMKQAKAEQQIKIGLALAKYVNSDQREDLLDYLIDTAHLIESPRQRCWSLIEILSCVPTNRRGKIVEDALTAARQDDPELVGTRLLEVARHLKPPERDQVIAEARSIPHSNSTIGPGWLLEARLLAGFGLPDSDAIAREAVNIVLENPWSTGLLLVADICPSDMVEEMANIARTVKPPTHLARILAELAHRTGGKWGEVVTAEATRVASEIGDPYERGEELACVADYVSNPARESIVELALAAARDISEQSLYAMLLDKVKPEIRPKITREAIYSARLKVSGEELAWLLARMVEWLPAELQDEVVKIVIQETINGAVRPWWTVQIQAFLASKGWVTEAVDGARLVRSPAISALALIYIAKSLTRPRKDELLTEAASLIKENDQSSWTPMALVALADTFSGKKRTLLIKRALNLASKERNGSSSYLLGSIARAWVPELNDKLIAVATRFPLSSWQPEDFGAVLAVSGPDENIIYEKLNTFHDEQWRMAALAALGNEIARTSSGDAINTVKAAARRLLSEAVYAEFIENLAAGPEFSESVDDWRDIRSSIEIDLLWTLFYELSDTLPVIVRQGGSDVLVVICWWP
jgi:hypothetical protein